MRFNPLVTPAIVTSLTVLACPRGAAADAMTQALRVHLGGDETDLLGFSIASIGDVDDDGVPDYVMGAPGYETLNGQIRMYSGADGSHIRTKTGWAPYCMHGASVASVGDLDGDGYSDLVVGAPLEWINGGPRGMVYIYSCRNGVLLQRWPADQEACLFGWSVAGVGDINDDGVPDVLVASPYYDGANGVNCGRVTLYSGANGSVLRTFQGPAPSARMGYSLASPGDLTGDGFDDALVGMPGAARAVVLNLRQGTIVRTLTNNVAGSNFGWSVARVGDSSGDGVSELVIGAPDFAVASATAGRVYVYDGALGMLRYYYTGVGAAKLGSAVANAGDFNGDGIDDVIVGSPEYGSNRQGRATVLDGFNATALCIVNGVSKFFGSAVAGAGDLNGDGMAEVIVGQPDYAVSGHSGAAYIYAGTVNGFTLTSAATYAVSGSLPSLIVASKINADGMPDIVTAGNNSATLLLNNSHGGFNAPKTYALANPPTAIVSCDINGDGRSDVVIATANDNKLNFYRSMTSTLARDSDLSLGGQPSSIVAGDFNRDGRVDLAVTFRGSHTLKILRNNGQSSLRLGQQLTVHQTFNVGLAPIQVAWARINTDAYPDLAVLNRDSKSVSILFNQPAGHFQWEADLPLTVTPLNMAIADFNHDAKGDLALILAATNKVAVHRGNGAGGFSPAQMFNTGAGPRTVVARDVDRDGHADLVTANWGNDKVSLLLNTGIGGFAVPLHKPVGIDPTGLVIEDLDSDEDFDIMTVNRNSASVSVLVNQWFR